jgi:hypothetical protein
MKLAQAFILCGVLHTNWIWSDALKSMYNNQFVNTAQLLTGYLHCQKNFIQEMKSIYP